MCRTLQGLKISFKNQYVVAALYEFRDGVPAAFLSLTLMNAKQAHLV